MKRVKEEASGQRLRRAFDGADNTTIASKLGKTSGAITNYMKGRIPETAILMKIHSLTGVSIHWLVFGEGPETVANLRYQDSEIEAIRTRAVIEYLSEQLDEMTGGRRGEG